MAGLKTKALFLIGLMILGLAVVLQAVRYKPAAESGKGKHLARTLPEHLANWSDRSIPLGPTEASEGAVEAILNFDDVFYREYTSGARTISLYVAYWNPGKMPTQVVASHTPDRCWTGAGWHCDAMRHAVVVSDLRPAEWREFSTNGTPDIRVAFWLLVGDETYDFGDRFTRVPSPWRWWRDVAKQIFRAPPEQYFIRLTSNVPFAQLKDDPGYQELLESLAKLGLAARRPET